MRVLVTGGAGFIGSHLVDALLGLGDEVICLDDLSTGRAENLAQHRGDLRFEMVEGDVADPFSFEVDRIYNLACPASPPHYQADPVRTTITCFMGALNSLRLAEETGARILQASTSEVYGDPEQHPQPESYVGNVNPIGVRSCYDEGKRVAESLCFDFHRSHGVDLKVVRIFNTYGPRMQEDDGRVVSNFILEALRGEPLTIYGSGSQTRSFCYVSDLVRGLLAVMEQSSTPGPYNLGNTEERTVCELVDEVAAATGRQVATSHLPAPSDDPRVRRPDLERVSTDVGWRPEVPLSEGLALTCADFKRRLAATGP
jgi:UDP-glucuronate decarboxylase